MEKAIKNFDKISINGQIFVAAEARINPLDPGFFGGLAAFETFRVSSQKIFLIEEHFDRLAKSLAALGIAWDDDRRKYYAWIFDLIKNNESDKDAFIRFLVTGGEAKTCVIIYAKQINKFQPTSASARTITSVKRQLPEYFETIGFRIKSPDYVYAKIAKLELKDDALQGILLSPDGFVAEALTANIFWTKNGQLFTPPLSLGILPGTVRQYLIDQENGQEKLAKIGEIEQAEEIFVTNGVNYLLAISDIDKIQKPGVRGTIYKQLFKKLGFSGSVFTV